MQEGICVVDGCAKARRYTSGLCPMHYQRLQKNGTTDLVVRPPKPRTRRVGVVSCEIDGCDKMIRARGWCVAHWTRWKRHGSPTARLRGEVVDGCKVCCRCGRDLPLAAFRTLREPCRDCDNALQRARAGARYIPQPKWETACEVCGETFQADKRQYLRCSPECKRRGETAANYKHVQARRAAMASLISESFGRKEILDRDAWHCALCGGQIDQTLCAPDPGSGSVDHVIPIALGGPHIRANVQAAHLGCNARKGARLIV